MTANVIKWSRKQKNARNKKFFLSKKKEKWIQNSTGGIGEHLYLSELWLVFGAVVYFGRGIYVKTQNMDQIHEIGAEE